jgi:radical SAM superfamily enzyme YgiQ (UPF0313 family)
MKRKLLIILPEGKIHRLVLGPFKMSFREAPLTATTLAALVPKELDFEITSRDESVQKLPLEEHYDLVAISLITGTAYRGYELARHYQERGSKVVLGGVHVTLLPDEAKQHADSIIIGFAERTWPQLLRDYCADRMQPVYKDLEQHYEDVPVPDRSVQANRRYGVSNVVSATRGCKNTCDFCAVPAAGFGWQTRPISSVIDEIKNIPSNRIVFNDVSMGEDMDHFKELLKALIPLKKRWGGLVSTKVFKDPEILDLIKKSGCVYLLIGFESLNDYSLSSIRKGFNKFSEYKMIIDQLHSINVVLMGCFIFGFDEDDKDIFEKTVDFVNEYRVDIPRYAIYTPYPGTQAFNRLKSEGRLLHEKWNHYDTQHVVFQPKLLSPEELDKGFIWAYRKTFTVGSSFKRTIHTGKNFFITFAGNLAYRIYIHRLMMEKNRIIIP